MRECWAAYFVLLLVSETASANCKSCNPGEYEPVCADGKAFKSTCYLTRAVCLGHLVLNDTSYGTCERLKRPYLSQRRDEDSRINFSGYVVSP